MKATKPGKLPETDSVQELAHFWDTHDLSDFETQLDEVREPVFERPTVIPLHLESAEAKVLKRMARRKGIAAAKLIHGWVVERLKAG
ncbi:MAG: CopG family antitoxin [Tepidisphaeraceae bacterium]